MLRADRLPPRAGVEVAELHPFSSVHALSRPVLGWDVLTEAIAMYRQIGMPEHAKMVEEMLGAVRPHHASVRGP